MAKIIFFQAHPDDELKSGQILHYLSKKSKNNHVVKVACITKGEWGLPGAQYDKFKGDLLAKIRTKELYDSYALLGVSPENIEFFGHFDGFVKFNEKLVNQVANYLKKEKPDIIFVSEPIYCWYYHGDHVNTGKAVFYCIYNKLIDCSPKLYFYGTLSPNYIFGFKKEDFELFEQMRKCHKTQFWLTYKMHRTFKLSTRLAARKLPGWKYAEKYRRVFFNEKNVNKNKPSLFVRIFSHFFSSLPFFLAQYPQEILDRLKKEGKI